MFIKGSSVTINLRTSGNRDSNKFLLLFRKALDHYFRKRVLPYLKLPGPVEIDETRIGRKRFMHFGTFPKLRWAFGLFCRTTQIPILFYIKNKTHFTLSMHVKNYVEKGATLFSDEHPSYVNLSASKSKLTRLGYFHFWVNHSAQYVHYKFPFNCT